MPLYAPLSVPSQPPGQGPGTARDDNAGIIISERGEMRGSPCHNQPPQSPLSPALSQEHSRSDDRVKFIFRMLVLEYCSVRRSPDSSATMWPNIWGLFVKLYELFTARRARHSALHSLCAQWAQWARIAALIPLREGIMRGWLVWVVPTSPHQLQVGCNFDAFS